VIKSMPNAVSKLPDGMVRVHFSEPVKATEAMLLILGFCRSNAIVLDDGGCVIEVTCRQKDWEDVIRTYVEPKDRNRAVSEFQAALKAAP
jgi:hypothetical protein